jgi:hypothetical protein
LLQARYRFVTSPLRGVTFWAERGRIGRLAVILARVPRLREI